MGHYNSKRLVRRLDLELFLSQIKPHPSPRADFEQYTVSEAVAATLLYIAAYVNNDVIDRNILDLGCGTGRIALAASFLGAAAVVGIDIDKKAISVAVDNSKRTGVKTDVHWIVGDISAITGKFDTVIQNPPFGVQKRYADRKFLEKALEVGNVIYSLHSHPNPERQLIRSLKANPWNLLKVAPSSFIENFVASRNGFVKAVYAMPMTIPHMFDFHTKLRYDSVIDLYIIEKNF
jgi:putative methylase